MGMFDVVTFNPADIHAVQNGTATRSQLFAVVTSQTCGEPCWHAREEICRCSCGGKNHGCLKSADGVQPVRMAKLDGYPYHLAGVGSGLYAEAARINREAGFRSVDKPSLVVDSIGSGCSGDLLAELAAARAAGHDAWVSQYYHSWSETDACAPARIKPASKQQLANWPELAAYRDCKPWEKPSLLWVREIMPQRPAQLKVDRDGIPLANQNPER